MLESNFLSFGEMMKGQEVYEVIFMACVDGDPIGKERLKRALEKERPDSVAVHVSEEHAHDWKNRGIEEAIRKYRAYCEEGLSQDAFAVIENQLKNVTGYEFLIPEQVCKESGIPLHYVGEPCDFGGSIIQDALGQKKQDMVRMNKFVNLKYLRQRAETIYGRFNAIFGDPIPLDIMIEQWYINQNAHELHCTPDTVRKIERCLQDGKKVVYVTNILQCLYDPEKSRTPFTRLRDEFAAKRVTIADQVYQV